MKQFKVMTANRRWFAVIPSGIATAILGAGLLLPALMARGQQARDAEHPHGKWEVLEGCRLVTNAVADGDSFQLEHKGRTYQLRLYFVDAPETDTTLRERIVDQAAYFGIAASEIPLGGKQAAQFTAEKLKGREFTVVTRWQNAMGRSGLARFYGIVLVKGENLAEELIANGLGRIYGLRANWPDGPRATTFVNKLKNLELTAREQHRGLWDERTFPRTAAGAGEAVAKTAPGTVDVNEASAEELRKLPGVGAKLAERIIAHRPYEKVDDLLRVPGIGAKSLEQFRALVRVEGAEGEK